MWNWFKGFFNEENGPSTTRLLNWVWTFTLCTSILFIIIFSAIKNNEVKLPDVPVAYITLTGLFLAAKVGQRVWGETPPLPDPPTEPPKLQ